MNSRERIINTVLGKPTDRAPFIFPFPPWGETIERWKEEGMKGDWLDEVDADDGFVLMPTNEIKLGYLPPFEYQVVEEDDRKIKFIDASGILQEAIKGHSTIPNYLKYPVESPNDWKRIKEERLQPLLEQRIPQDKAFYENFQKSHDGITQVGWCPYGLFGTARDMIGVEDLLLWFYDEPDTIADIMNTLTDLWIQIYGELTKHIRIDCIHIWEDMSGKAGPLISPAMIREYMVPNYRKIRDFCDANNIPILSMDTDGDCDLLITPFIEAGVNLMFPFEVAAGSDVNQLIEKYGDKLCIMGGIDKREIAKGEYEIDKELERIAPAIESGHYIPGFDHLIHPEVSYSNFLYFCKKLKQLIGK